MDKTPTQLMLSNIDRIRSDGTIVTKSGRETTADIIIANGDLKPGDTVVILNSGNYAIFMGNNLYYDVFTCSVLLLYINQVMKIDGMQEAVKRLYASSDSLKQAKIALLKKMAEGAEKIRKMNIKFKMLESGDDGYIGFLNATLEELDTMLENNPNVQSHSFDHSSNRLIINHQPIFDIFPQYDGRVTRNDHDLQLMCKLPEGFTFEIPLVASQNPYCIIKHKLPHLSDSNSICFGNAGDQYNIAIRDLEYISAVEILFTLATNRDFRSPFTGIATLFSKGLVTVKGYETTFDPKKFSTVFVEKANSLGINEKETFSPRADSNSNFFNILHSYLTTTNGSTNDTSDTPAPTVTLTPNPEIVFDDELDGGENPPF